MLSNKKLELINNADQIEYEVTMYLTRIMYGDVSHYNKNNELIKVYTSDAIIKMKIGDYLYGNADSFFACNIQGVSPNHCWETSFASTALLIEAPKPSENLIAMYVEIPG